ncbi:MAG: argininosuccinate lyase, partial [Bacillota bacterium]
DVADYLVEEGLPFREAHEVVGETVLYCIKKDKKLSELSMTEWQNFSDKFSEDIYDKIAIETCVDARSSVGGPAKEEVERVITAEREAVAKLK